MAVACLVAIVNIPGPCCTGTGARGKSVWAVGMQACMPASLPARPFIGRFITMLMRIKTKLKEHHKTSFPLARYLLDGEYGFYVEEYFKERLSFERKRIERFKRPFLLMMLLNFDNFSLIDKKRKVISRVKEVLFSFTRETDLKGWYQYDSVLGTLFTEMKVMDKNRIKVMVCRNLCNSLGMELFKKIKISFHTFPDNDKDSNSDHSPDLTLFPDVSRLNASKRHFIFMKRVIDIIGSVLAVIMFSPFFIIIPILIKISSKGPVLFNQKRVGLNGKEINFLKFRTMYNNSDPHIHREYTEFLIKGKIMDKEGKSDPSGNGIYKLTHDTRITPTGKVLRRLSLDELPQFFNVLKGEMSLVGPRPPIPYEFEHYDTWHKRRVMEVKPGISGLWQVNGRSSTTFDEMVRLDLKYAKEKSLWLDIKILLKTPLAVFSTKGAY